MTAEDLKPTVGFPTVERPSTVTSLERHVDNLAASWRCLIHRNTPSMTNRKRD